MTNVIQLYSKKFVLLFSVFLLTLNFSFLEKSTGQEVKFVTAQNLDRQADKIEANKLLHFAPEEINEVNRKALNRIIEINLQDVPMSEALKQIAEFGDLRLAYSEDISDAEWEKPVTLQYDQATVLGALYAALGDSGLELTLSSNNSDSSQLVVTNSSLNRQNSEKSELFTEDYLQETITGNIVDGSTGEALPGVNILVRGTDRGTTTNIDGEFELNVESLDVVLIVSFIGYEQKEVRVAGRTVVDIELTPSVMTGDDVVVVGYGTIREENLTGSVSSMDMGKIESRPVTSTSAALQGQIPGVFALQESGRAGGDGATIRIRGQGTLNNSDPLVIIDGVPGNIDDVNPQDIESVSVLKDAASAAIYGSRAANGVIQVTTRTGVEGQLNFSYNGQFGWQQPTALPGVLNSVQYATLGNEASRNSGMQPMYTEDEIDLFRSGTDPMYPDINYYDVMYSDFAPMQNHQLNVSGGSSNLQYAFMLGYRDQQGVLIANDHDRVNFRSNLNASFLENDRLRVSARLSGNRGRTVNPWDDWGTRWYANVAPVHPLTNADGEWAAIFGENNFYAEAIEGASNENFRRVYNGQVSAEMDIVYGLSAELNYGYNITQTRWNTFRANTPLDNLDGTSKTIQSSLNEHNEENTQSMFNSLLRFEHNYNVHDFNLLAGYQQEYFYTHWNNAFRSGFINNTQRVIGMGDPATQSTGGGASDLGMESLFGRFGYIYDNRYMFEANLRYDGSSRFAEGNQWGTFPSFSVGWNISQEGFMSNINWLDFLRVRASWGKLGNENIFSRYAATPILSTGANYITAGSNLRSGVAMTSLANEDVTWETTTQTNFGVDIRVYDGFDFSVDVFRRDTEDILMQIPIPISMGALSPPFQNVGAVRNQGVEFSGEYTGTFDNGIFLNVNMNLSHVRNEVIDLFGRSPIISGMTVLKEGYPINSFYGYIVDGLYQVDDFTWQNNSDPNISHADRNYQLRDGVVDVSHFNPQPGDLKYRDLNGDGTVTLDGDRTVIGDQNPDFTYSFQVNTAYRNFDMGVFLQGVHGIEGYTSAELVEPFNNFFNLGDWWLDRWTIENPDTDIPRIHRSANRRDIHSEFLMEDASYLRIKNVELGYTLPSALTSQLAISQLRVYGSIQNAYTFTNFRGFDPEQPTGETRAQAYPQSRIFNLGININF